MIGAARKRAGSLVVSASFAAALAITGCTRCLGVADCIEAPHYAVTGQLVRADDGLPSPGATVRLVASHADGTDSVVSVSDDRGLFTVELPARAAPAGLTLRVLPSGLPGYDLTDLRCAPMEVRGDACIIGTILTAPRLDVLTQFVHRQAVHLPIAGGKASFVRTSGSEPFGPNTQPTYSGTTDASGSVRLFPNNIAMTSMEPMTGDLTLVLPAPFGTSVFRGLRFHPVYRLGGGSVAVVAMGPNLDYIAQFTDSATSKGLQGVEVGFERVSGISTDPDSFTRLSDGDGIARFPLRPLAVGEVRAKVTIHPPNGLTTVLNNSALTTFDSDDTQVFGRFLVGSTGILYPVTPGGKP